MSMIEVAGVTKRFGATLAVAEVSFTLERGRFLTILGPSGSGKTTLLRMIAGFIRPDAGEIVLRGEPVSKVPPYRRSIGMVFQRLALFPHMSAAENIAYPLKMRRRDARTIPERVRRYLELVRLDGLGDRRIRELSGGQQQRVAIARALVFEPDLLLLDEPLASLDRKLREDMQLEFRRIQHATGVTTINVTHDQREALVMSDEVIVMDDGRLQQHGSPVEAYQRPRNRFVAGFIGVTNFVPGRVAEVDGATVALAVGEGIWRGRRAGEDVRAGQEAVGALRAERIRLAPSGETLEGLDTVLEARITDAIFEGDRIVHTVSPVAEPAVELRVFDHDPRHAGLDLAGATVRIGWNAEDLAVFGA